MKLNFEEKKAFLDNLKNRMLKIEKVIGDIKFYENNSKEKTSEENKDCYLNESNIIIDDKDNEIKSEENKNIFNELKSYLENIPFDNFNANKEELIEMIKKHKHKNSISVHLCAIKIILQQISKDFLCDIYNHYNDFYIYIHSNSIVDVYNTFEYKKNIILSHLDFMRNYSSKIKEIVKLKENINSYKISETEIYMDRLKKIENKNELLFSKISEINTSLEDVAYKYGVMMQLASLIFLKYKSNIS
ncbi:conserved Plasmodium protein, unknown function [Plasmodium gallinaceum]|uniref:Uncharacterized protein n=1 Tax=Plasmodium gallinaceum TaxID=5849 RepID=A0A1J1H161_PLAGA|nr:conserved Plasmodium protein, unknown function [Plasmodium gallinaceum]CRG97021.1 conserved Plasmodium protein, unknown function [Plasmodium gallinaceum]